MRPGIQTPDNNEGPAGIAPVKKSRKGCLMLALAGAAGATALALSQCGQKEETPASAPVPEATKQPDQRGKYLYRYNINRDIELREASTKTIVKEGSCVLTTRNDDNTTPALRNNDQDIKVEAITATSGTRIGLIAVSELQPAGITGDCKAEFVEAPAADTPILSTGPVQQWRTASANLYNMPDATSPVVDSISDGCVGSTGKVSGDFMEVTIDNGDEKRTFWTPAANYTKTQVEICQAKISFTP